MTTFEGSAERGTRVALVLILAAILAAVFGRVIAAAGGPGALTFLHFPLVVMAMALTRHPTQGFAAKTGRALVWFSGWVVVSSLMNLVSPLRAMLTWLVWVEPLLVLYVVSIALLNVNTQKRDRRLAIFVFGTCVAGQLLLMTAQIPRRAIGSDEMQGTFLGSGTGAHTAPALLLIGAIFLLGRVIDVKRLGVRLGAITIAAYGFVLSVLGAARAVVGVVAVAIGGAIVFLSIKESRHKGRPLVALAMTVAVVAGLVIGGSGVLSSKDGPILEQGLSAKTRGILFLANQMSQDAASLVVGVGPGNSVSRVALETPDARLNPLSPIAGLGLETAPITKAITEMQANAGIGGSSLFSPWTTLVGVFGDVGILGLALYLVLWWPVLQQVRRARADLSTGNVFIVLAALFTAIGLGAYQIFLEDPGFALPAALLIAVSLGQTKGTEFVSLPSLSDDAVTSGAAAGRLP